MTDGKVVRKDLTKLIKEGANVPNYVLEYLLGMYCATDIPTDGRHLLGSSWRNSIPLHQQWVIKRNGMRKKIKEILAHPNHICLFFSKKLTYV